MKPIQLVSRLQSSNPLSEETRRALFSSIELKVFDKGDFLFREGEIDRHIYFVESGLVRCFYYLDDQEDPEAEITAWFLPPGGFACSVLSFFNQSPSVENLQALEKTRVLMISHEQLQDLYARFSDLNMLGRHIMEEYLQQYDLRTRLLRLRRSEQRYEGFLQIYPDLANRITVKHLASYLGLHPDNLSRVRSRMSKFA